MPTTLKNCQICNQVFEGEYPLCSAKCEALCKFAEDIAWQITEHKNTQDTRIFFYDIGFGELCDKYAIMIIRYEHQDKLKGRKETDFYIRRLRDAIMSKINRSCYHPATKQNAASLIKELFNVNAEMWRLRGIALGGDKYSSSASEAAHDYFTKSYQRDDLRDQLDALVDGRIRNSRVYPV